MILSYNNYLAVCSTSTVPGGVDPSSTLGDDSAIGDVQAGDVANSKRPLLIILKVQLRLRVTRRSATALARYPQKLAKIVCG